MNKVKKDMTCIVCPMGCFLEVEIEDGSYTITGNRCKRGEEYAIKELISPMRVLTSTVRLKNSYIKKLPVRTDGVIPKSLMFECVKLLKTIEVEAPVKMGDIIFPNILNTGVNVISSRSI